MTRWPSFADSPASVTANGAIYLVDSEAAARLLARLGIASEAEAILLVASRAEAGAVVVGIADLDRESIALGQPQREIVDLRTGPTMHRATEPF